MAKTKNWDAFENLTMGEVMAACELVAKQVHAARNDISHKDNLGVEFLHDLGAMVVTDCATEHVVAKVDAASIRRVLKKWKKLYGSEEY